MSNGHGSRRCRSSPLSLGGLSCGVAHPAATDSLMRHAVSGARAGRAASQPVHSCERHGLAHDTARSTDCCLTDMSL